jgi:hypothetical protein
MRLARETTPTKQVAESVTVTRVRLSQRLAERPECVGTPHDRVEVTQVVLNNARRRRNSGSITVTRPPVAVLERATKRRSASAQVLI